MPAVQNSKSQEALVEQLEKKVGFPMKHKPYRSLDEIMREYRRRHPDLDWETRDEDWFRVEQARVAFAQTFVQTLVTRTFFWSIFLRRFCFFVTLQDRLVRAYLSKGVEGIDRLVASILPHHSWRTRHARMSFWRSTRLRCSSSACRRRGRVFPQPQCTGGKPSRPPPAGLYDRSFQSRLDGEDYRRLVMTSDGFLINTINMTVTPANKERAWGSPTRELFAVLDELNVQGVLQETPSKTSCCGCLTTPPWRPCGCCTPAGRICPPPSSS